MNGLRLRVAWFLSRLGVWLGDVEDRILKPLVKEGKSMPSLVDLEKLIRSFPPGYHRSELRTEWRKRKDDN